MNAHGAHSEYRQGEMECTVSDNRLRHTAFNWVSFVIPCGSFHFSIETCNLYPVFCHSVSAKCVPRLKALGVHRSLELVKYRFSAFRCGSCVCVITFYFIIYGDLFDISKCRVSALWRATRHLFKCLYCTQVHPGISSWLVHIIISIDVRAISFIYAKINWMGLTLPLNLHEI